MFEKLTAVLVVGGKGARLGLTKIPKALVPIAGVPLLERSIRQLADQGVRRIALLAGHLGEQIEQRFGDGSTFGLTIDVIREAAPLGPAGCFHAVRDRLNEPFIVIYGDVLWDVDLARFVAFARDRGGLGTLYAHPNDHPFDSDLIEADAKGKILAFHPKPHAGGLERRNLVNAAFYVLSPAILDHVPAAPTASDWGADVFPAVVRNGGALHAYRGAEYIHDIGTPARLARSEAALLGGAVAARSYRHPQTAVFLDRDGVLNREIDGVRSPDQLELLPGVAEAVCRINRSGALAICVTNQPGRAKGWLDEAQLEAIHARLDAELARDGAYLDDLLVCPHHPETGWPGEDPSLKIACECRKPEPGLLTAAMARHNIDPARSVIVGDHWRDIEAGRRAGVKGILVGSDAPPVGAQKAGDLAAAVELFFAERAVAKALA